MALHFGKVVLPNFSTALIMEKLAVKFMCKDHFHDSYKPSFRTYKILRVASHQPSTSIKRLYKITYSCFNTHQTFFNLQWLQNLQHLHKDIKNIHLPKDFRLAVKHLLFERYYCLDEYFQDSLTQLP